MTGKSGPSGLRMAGAGVQLAAALIGGLYGGQWLDRRFGTAPVFLYGGVAIGAVGGMTALYRQLMRAVRDEEEARKL
jgi:ATP synthase protein I